MLHNQLPGGQPCFGALANCHGINAPSMVNFQPPTRCHPRELGKDAQNRLSVRQPAHIPPLLRVFGTEMWGFLDISIVDGNHKEYFELGLSENQGPTATNIFCPPTHSACHSESTVPFSLECMNSDVSLYYPYLSFYLFIRCVLVLNQSHTTPGGTIHTASGGNISPGAPPPTAPALVQSHRHLLPDSSMTSIWSPAFFLSSLQSVFHVAARITFLKMYIFTCHSLCKAL